MPTKYTGAHALVDTLKACSVTKIFSLSGNHIMPVYDALYDSGIELFHTRHEAAAVHMADAYARITGKVGVALVTGGPGHANAVSALYTAQMAESPVVLLSGHAPISQLGKGAFQEMQQADMARPVCKESWTCQAADDVSNDIGRAIRAALSGRPGPIHLSLPSDALEKSVDHAPMDSTDPPSTLNTLNYVANSNVKLVFDKLYQSSKPLIFLGASSMSRHRRARFEALETALGIPVVGMESPRGVADPSLGAFAQTLAECDCVLLLGKRLDFTLKFGASPTFAANCQFLGGRLIFSTRADVDTVAQQLINAAPTKTQTHDAWFDAVKAAISYRPESWNSARSSMADRLHPVEAMRPLQALLDSHPDAVFVCDGGEIGQWAQACLTAPHRVINGVAGSIGGALPFALGARVAVGPDVPVVAVMGDGTFGFHCAEFDTAVRYGLPFLAVVGNDARWNAEYQIQLREYGANRLIGCELLPTRYDAVTAAFGGHGEYVTRAEDLLPAAHRALASQRPACLNVMIDGLAAPNVKR
jgi:acetolactate synthase I/II/III large subunit